MSIVCFFHVPKNIRPAQATLMEKLLQMDLLGFLTITASVILYLLAFQWAGVEKRWGSADVIGLLVGSGTLSLMFIANEWWQGERALLLPTILKEYTISNGCIFCFL